MTERVVQIAFIDRDLVQNIHISWAVKKKTLSQTTERNNSASAHTRWLYIMDTTPIFNQQQLIKGKYALCSKHGSWKERQVKTMPVMKSTIMEVTKNSWYRRELGGWGLWWRRQIENLNLKNTKWTLGEFVVHSNTTHTLKRKWQLENDHHHFSSFPSNFLYIQRHQSKEVEIT